MLFFKHLALSVAFYGIATFASPTLVPRVDFDSIDIENTPSGGANCQYGGDKGGSGTTVTVAADQIIAALKQGHKWKREGIRMGAGGQYPAKYNVTPGAGPLGSEFDYLELAEYPILVGADRTNPWKPTSKNTPIRGPAHIRVVFHSKSDTEAVFAGVVEKDPDA
ncbi:MAG: hypothetical protein Q9205_007428, partial [Flavoplaca limonia]